MSKKLFLMFVGMGMVITSLSYAGYPFEVELTNKTSNTYLVSVYPNEPITRSKCYDESITSEYVKPGQDLRYTWDTSVKHDHEDCYQKLVFKNLATNHNSYVYIHDDVHSDKHNKLHTIRKPSIDNVTAKGNIVVQYQSGAHNHVVGEIDPKS